MKENLQYVRSSILSFLLFFALFFHCSSYCCCLRTHLCNCVTVMTYICFLVAYACDCDRHSSCGCNVVCCDLVATVVLLLHRTEGKERQPRQNWRGRPVHDGKMKQNGLNPCTD